MLVRNLETTNPFLYYVEHDCISLFLTVAATEESPEGPLQTTRIPQVMSTNPTYAGFSNDAIYDCITDQKDLKNLQHSQHVSNNIPKTLFGDIPPQVCVCLNL